MFKPIVFLAGLILAFPAMAEGNAKEAVKSAADATVHGLEKGQEVVVKGAKAGVAGATKGVQKVGSGITHVEKKAGLPAGEGNPPRDTSKTE